MVVLLATLFVMAGQAQAANQVAVKSCVIGSNKKSVEVRAVGAGSVPGTDGKYYLYALEPYETQIGRTSAQIASARQSGLLSFRVSLNKNTAASMLYKKFAVAVRKSTNGQYVLASNAMYISNPEKLAKYTYAFPKAASKKGLQTKASMLADAEDLRIRHAAINICLNRFPATSARKNSRSSYAYTYQGKKYWFLKSACKEIDTQVQELTRMGAVVSGILLLQDSGAGRTLIAPGARGTGKAFYGLNTMNKEGVETLAALMSFLGERYMKSSKANGRIVNWIVGNEVNNFNVYNYLGRLSFDDYVSAYARSFRVVSTALRSVYNKARVYISLDFCWNVRQGSAYTSKKMLDAFAKLLKSEGDISWNLAFHPYPDPLTSPVFWDDPVSSSDSTRTVTMKNIGYLTNYLSRNFRSDVRVLLSEQGFTSKTGKTVNQKLQAAAFAYAYYLTEFNPKIDAFIMNRHVDHVTEEKQGLSLGLWTNRKGQVETASDKKVIYDVFKYIDSSGSKSVSEFALAYIGASSWASKIPGFQWSHFHGMGAYASGRAAGISKSSGTKTITNALKYAYTGKVRKSGKNTIVTVDNSANRNLYQGAGWSYAKKLNFSARSRFLCRIRISGMRESYAHVRLRFFSGNNIYEASAKVKGNGTRRISCDLSKWKYRGSVDKIQIWVRPYNRTTWKRSGKITVSYLQQAKKTGR